MRAASRARPRKTFTENTMNKDEQWIAIESKLAHQEYLLDVLNQTVYQQQKQIDEIDNLCKALAKRLGDLQARQPDAMLPHEKPPHY
jgi:SlyX protein